MRPPPMSSSGAWEAPIPHLHLLDWDDRPATAVERRGYDMVAQPGAQRFIHDVDGIPSDIATCGPSLLALESRSSGTTRWIRLLRIMPPMKPSARFGCGTKPNNNNGKRRSIDVLEERGALVAINSVLIVDTTHPLRYHTRRRGSPSRAGCPPLVWNPNSTDVYWSPYRVVDGPGRHIQRIHYQLRPLLDDNRDVRTSRKVTLTKMLPVRSNVTRRCSLAKVLTDMGEAPVAAGSPAGTASHAQKSITWTSSSPPPARVRHPPAVRYHRQRRSRGRSGWTGVGDALTGLGGSSAVVVVARADGEPGHGCVDGRGACATALSPATIACGVEYCSSADTHHLRRLGRCPPGLRPGRPVGVRRVHSCTP